MAPARGAHFRALLRKVRLPFETSANLQPARKRAKRPEILPEVLPAVGPPLDRRWIARGPPADRSRTARGPRRAAPSEIRELGISRLYRRPLKSRARMRARNVFFAFQPSGRLWLLSLCTRAYARTQSFLHFTSWFSCRSQWFSEVAVILIRMRAHARRQCFAVCVYN